VAPETFDGVRYLVDQLDAIQASPLVFKVIPERVATAPELIAFLRDQQDNGSEIVLHGYSHQRIGAWRGPLRRRLRAQLFSPRAAEFLSLSAADVEARLSMGRSALESAGLGVSGFCAPGWIESEDVRPALRRLGFRYDLAMTHVADLAGDRRILTDWLGFMGAGPVQERFVGIANRLNRLALPAFSVVKVFLHPQNARESSACRQILEFLPRLMENRRLTTYATLLDA
jgi:predicted deacetylase